MSARGTRGGWAWTAALLLAACPRGGTKAAGGNEAPSVDGQPESASPNRRVSRPGAGTIVGITVRQATPAAVVEDAFTALDAAEARYSEWNPESMTSRAARGTPQALDEGGVLLFKTAFTLGMLSGGAFNIGHGGTAWFTQADTLTVEGAGLDLGGLLKGFLADRAADALRGAGVTDFAVDAGGDVVVGGSLLPGGDGWPADVVLAGRVATVTVTQALSTSSQEQQPGHVVDGRTGLAATGLAGVYVTAPTGLLADGQATALLASGGAMALLPGSCAVLVNRDSPSTRRCAE